jgi:hypothetical protein
MVPTAVVARVDVYQHLAGHRHHRVVELIEKVPNESIGRLTLINLLDHYHHQQLKKRTMVPVAVAIQPFVQHRPIICELLLILFDFFK